MVLAVRSGERGQSAASAIRETIPAATVEVMVLDLADLASVRRFASALGSRFSSLGLLINNAGVASPSRQRTADGFELDFGTNHLGHFALTGLLLAMILCAPKARVITVTSMAHRRGRIDFGSLDGAQGYWPARAYAQSKLANVLFACELQRRLSRAGAGQLSVACHPGWAATSMTLGTADQHPRPQDRLYRLLARRLAPSAARGAQPVLFAATTPGVRGGDFIGPTGRFGVQGDPGPVRSGDRTRDQDLARRLWRVSEQMTGVTYNFTDSPSS